MSSRRNNTLLIVLGWTLLIAGVVGLLLPFLQGIVLIIAGSVILSSHSPFFRRHADRLKDRYPKLFTFTQKQHSKNEQNSKQ